jgi:hypothetical protein
MVRLLEPVLDHEMEVVALIEDLALDVRMELLKLADLLVLLGHQLLIHGGDLDEQIVVGEIEVGGEELDGLPFLVGDGEAAWLVVPRNAVEVEEKSELPLAVVSELDFVRA